MTAAAERSDVPEVIAARLSSAMRSDLGRCYTRYILTVETFDYPHGDAIRLRTGRALQRRRLVRVGNAGSANRPVRWLPTDLGVKVARALQKFEQARAAVVAMEEREGIR